MEPNLFHGIRDYNLYKLINILKCGYILPRKDLEEKYRYKNIDEVDLNGNEWISLSQKSLYDEYMGSLSLSSFYRFSYNHLCFVIKNNFKDIHYTNFIDFDLYGSAFFKSMVKDDSNERYSSFMDEVQTNIPIPRSDFLAIGYPKKAFQEKCDVKKDLRMIKEILENTNTDIPIVDSSYYDFADNKEKIKKYTIV